MNDLWPVHLKPQEDELLSSWIARLAIAHGLGYRSFCALAWPTKQYGTRDLDCVTEPDLFTRLHKGTATPLDRVRRGSLDILARQMTGAPRSYDCFQSGLLPLGNFVRKNLHAGLQYCPLCLSEDRHPYFRRRWRLTFLTLCDIHKILLHDRCTNCFHPIIFFNNSSSATKNLYQCTVCGSDLRQSPSSAEVNPELIGFQQTLLQALEELWTNALLSKPMPSFLFLQGVLAFLKMLARLHIGSKSRGKVPSTEERAELVHRAANFLSNWPDGFIDYCQANNIASHTFLYGMEQLPFWLWQPIHQHLIHPNYSPSEEEISSAITYLRSRGQSVNPHRIAKTLGLATSQLNHRTISIKSLIDLSRLLKFKWIN